jgi:peptidoglycan hydrolase CwlO-like protein
MSLFSSLLFLSAATPISATQITTNTSDTFSVYFPYLLSALMSILTGWISYTVAIKKNNRQDFDSLLEANSKFREEVKKELDASKITIEELKITVGKKDKEITDMQSSIAELQNQLIIRETSISELNVQIMKRDLRIQELEDRMDELSKSTK